MSSSTQVCASKSDSDTYGQYLIDLGEKIEAQKKVIEELQASLTEGLQGICEPTEGFQRISELVANQTAQIDTLKSRQAASAALQVIQFLLFAGYLITLAVNYVVRKCKKYRKKKGEEEVELLEQKLQERKSRRRAAARQSSADK